MEVDAAVEEPQAQVVRREEDHHVVTRLGRARQDDVGLDRVIVVIYAVDPRAPLRTRAGTVRRTQKRCEGRLLPSAPVSTS